MRFPHWCLHRPESWAGFVLLIVASTVEAAIPSVSHLYPAGGQRGTTVTVKVADNPIKPVPSVWCSDPKIKIQFAKKADSITVEIPADSAPGVRWIRFYNAEGTTPPKPFLVGLIPEQKEVEPNNRVSSAQVIEGTKVCVNGILHARNENDSYRVALKTGQTLVASMEANRSIGSPMDSVLQIVSPDGFVLSQNDDDKGFDSQLAFTAKADGDVIVRMFAFPATPNSTVGFSGAKNYVYRLTLTTEAFINHVLPTPNATNPNAEYRVFGWNFPGSGRENANSATITIGTAANQLQLIPNGDGALSMFTESAANSLAVASSVASTLEQTATDTVTPFELPTCLQGAITVAGQPDRFSFAGKKGQKVTAVVRAKSRYSKLDAVLKLVDENGKVIKEVDDSTRKVADCVLNASLPTDGQFTLSIFDRFDHAGFQYFYAIDISETTPDYSIDVKTDSFVVSAGKPLKIPVEINRIGFNDDVVISVRGLPKGVTAKDVTSAGKGKTAKKVEVEVEIATSKTSWSGPISIISTSNKLTRTAATTTVGQIKLTDYWLTITRAK